MTKESKGNQNKNYCSCTSPLKNHLEDVCKRCGGYVF